MKIKNFYKFITSNVVLFNVTRLDRKKLIGGSLMAKNFRSSTSELHRFQQKRKKDNSKDRALRHTTAQTKTSLLAQLKITDWTQFLA